MSTELGSPGSNTWAWVVAAIAGVVAFVLLRVVGDLGFFPALILALLVFGLIVLILFWAYPPQDLPVGTGLPGDQSAPAVAAESATSGGIGHQPTPAAGAGSGLDAPPAALRPLDRGAPDPERSAPEPRTPEAAVMAPDAQVAQPPDAAPVPPPAAVARPGGLSGPRGGVADDLKAIEGIGPVLEKLCHDLGVYHFDQIASWGAGEIAWMDSNLKGFKGRVTRDRWVPQARIVVTEGLASLRERARTNNY